MIIHRNALQKPIVSPGVNQLTTAAYLNQLKNKRVALLANTASRNARGENTIDILNNNPHIHLTELFSAEHGIRETHDEKYASTHDAKTGLRVYSLYGAHTSPTKAALKNIDVIVIDLQDVGVRYYTYATTMALIMKAAKKYGKTVMILDRPNPLNGVTVSGPLLAKKFQGGFASYYPLPMRHGLTMGELAQYFNRYFKIHCKLVVVPMEGWHRTMFFNQTGLRWTPPSPALPSFKQTFLYGIFGPLETLNLSVGRSHNNALAFEIFGAPWITKPNAKKLVAQLNQEHLPGLRFAYYHWSPNRAAYKGEPCYGFRVFVGNTKNVQGFKTLLTVLKILNQDFGAKQLALDHIDGMIGTAWVREDLQKGMSINAILKKVTDNNRPFRQKRKAILIYDE